MALSFSDQELRTLAEEIGTSDAVIKNRLSSPANLNSFKVNELKRVIQFVRQKTCVPISLSGVKNDLVSRLGAVLFSGNGPAPQPIPLAPRQSQQTQSPALQSGAQDQRWRTMLGATNNLPRTQSQPSIRQFTDQLAHRNGSHFQFLDRLDSAHAAYANSLLAQISSHPSFAAFNGIPRAPSFNPQELAMSDRFMEKQDPFFEQVRLLGTIGLGTSTGLVNVKGDFEVDRATFSMIQADLMKRRLGEKCGLAVHIRLFSSKHQDVGWITEMRPKINRRPVDPPVLRKVRSASKDPYVTYPPMDITAHLISGRNLVELERPVVLSGVAAIQLVAMRTPQEVVQRMMRCERERAALAAALSASNGQAPDLYGQRTPATPAPPADQSTPSGPRASDGGDSDVEIEEQVTTVSLRCPLSYQRLRIAAKGKACRHLQCFDLQAFLEFSHQQHVWHCPVCNRQLPYSQLVVDELISRVLESVPPEETHVVVSPDGTWTAASQAAQPGVPSSSSSSSTKRRRPEEGEEDGVVEYEAESPAAEPPPSKRPSSVKDAAPEVIVLDSDDESTPSYPSAHVVVKTEPAPAPQPAPAYPFGASSSSSSSSPFYHNGHQAQQALPNPFSSSARRDHRIRHAGPFSTGGRPASQAPPQPPPDFFHAQSLLALRSPSQLQQQPQLPSAGAILQMALSQALNRSRSQPQPQTTSAPLSYNSPQYHPFPHPSRPERPREAPAPSAPPSDLIIIDLEDDDPVPPPPAPPPPPPEPTNSILAPPIWTGFSRLPEFLPAVPPEEQEAGDQGRDPLAAPQPPADEDVPPFGLGVGDDWLLGDWDGTAAAPDGGDSQLQFTLS